MGWEYEEMEGFGILYDKNRISMEPWEDWNHWRMVEQEIRRDQTLLTAFLKKSNNEQNHPFTAIEIYLEADLPTRLKALIAVLDSN